MKELTGRERFLLALANEKTDRLPCQVHDWMAYYLATYLSCLPSVRWTDAPLGNCRRKRCGRAGDYDPHRYGR